MTPINMSAHLPIMATAYAESKKHNPKEHDAIISDILNKAESGKEKYGAHTGSISQVLNHNYSSVKKQSPAYLEAMSMNFKNQENEHNFKKVITRFSGIMHGNISRNPFKEDTVKTSGRKALAKQTGTIR